MWYDVPSADWNEALSLGNGRLGAMVYGNPTQENIQLNESTLWAGGPHSNNNLDAKEIKKWITVYDKAWVDYNKLLEQYNRVVTLYTQDYDRHIAHNTNQKVNELRTQK
ncbi:glycoside hydrolase N-terminal domain-containing protein [uncultured Formosa sp.]|uniref:glycoside hydrolase N-terminal domain-containing protein n=1 Tax=uncultured Formosa sp. TaxID=255435 RepID=UPI002615CA09|nr:glycoside hydrolase N-terminal domain-containing protein [uncultured Formosa sp.]